MVEPHQRADSLIAYNKRGDKAGLDAVSRQLAKVQRPRLVRLRQLIINRHRPLQAHGVFGGGAA